MDVFRQIAAAAAVILLAAAALLAVRCHARGLIGRKRALAMGGAALCAALSAAGLLFAFVPRAAAPGPGEAGQPAESANAQKDPSEGPDKDGGQPAVTGDGRVVYRASTPDVEPADPEPPKRGAAQEQGGQADGQASQPIGDRGVGQADAAAADGQEARQTGEGEAGTPQGQNPLAAQPLEVPQGHRADVPEQTPLSASGPQTVADDERTGSLRLDFLCGGACTLALLPDSTAVLVGSGGDADADEVLSHLAALGISEVSHLVLTGPEEECVGGAAQILSHVRVETLVVPGPGGTGASAEVESEAARTGTQVRPADRAFEVASGDARVHVAPAGDGHTVVRASYAGSVALLPGGTGPAAALAASPGRADVVDAAGWPQAEGGLDRAARETWPRVAVVSPDASAESLDALAMAERLEAGNNALTVVIGPDGSISTPR